MNQFTFETRQKQVLIGFMALGVLCLGLTFLGDDVYHSRFWSNFLHNSVFFTGIAFISLFVLAAFATAHAGWHTVLKRVWEAYALFLIPGIILMGVIIVGLVGHAHHLYHWADAGAVATDRIMSGKAAFLNPVWYSAGTLIILGVWIFFALKLRGLSLKEDEQSGTDYATYRSVRWWSAAFLPIAGFTSAAMVWQWVMSVDAHWYSTLFAWYATASWFVSAMALTILTLIYLKSKGYYENVTAEHFHDLGKYLFAFSIFWTYLWFSQYMLIWYANNGEETVYFHHRRENYPALFYINLIINFVLPFLILMRNDTKRKYGTLVFTSIIVFFGHWLDFFLMLKPGIRHTTMEAIAHSGGHADHAGHEGHHVLEFAAGFTMPGLLEIGTMLGFLALFMYFVFGRMAKASLSPKNDPYLAESLHHHV